MVWAKSRLGEGAERQTVAEKYISADPRLRPDGLPVTVRPVSIRAVATRHAANRTEANYPGLDNLTTDPGQNNYKQFQIVTKKVRGKSRLAERIELHTIRNNYVSANRRLWPAGPPVAACHATIRTVATRPGLDNIGARHRA